MTCRAIALRNESIGANPALMVQQVRLMRLSGNQRERLARESWDESIARLERMNTNLAKGEIGKRVSGHRTSVLLIAITLHSNQII